MINIFAFSGLPVAVFGLGRSGLSVAEALIKSDSEVWAWDDNIEARKSAEKLGINLVNLYEFIRKGGHVLSPIDNYN